jgi:hypothetical protein
VENYKKLIFIEAHRVLGDWRVSETWFGGCPSGSISGLAEAGGLLDLKEPNLD